MLGSIPHQKICFYHLPTRGRAGIKLGDAWYVSNESIIFWLFHAIILPVLDVYWLYFTLLYHFWDYPTNRRPSPNCCFFAYFSVSKKRSIKRSPNVMKPSGAIFLEQTLSRGLGVDVKQQRRRPRGCPARPLLVGTPPHPHGPLGRPPTYFFLLYIPRYPENIQEQHETQFPPT